MSERWCEGERDGEKGTRGAFLFIRHALFFLDPSTSALDGRRFESAISRRARKLRRLDHSEAELEKAAVLLPLLDVYLFPPSIVTQQRSTPRSLARLDV